MTESRPFSTLGPCFAASLPCVSAELLWPQALTISSRQEKNRSIYLGYCPRNLALAPTPHHPRGHWPLDAGSPQPKSLACRAGASRVGGRDQPARCTLDIRALILDVDGVLTDGSLSFGPDGGVALRFHTHDGVGLALWRQAGGQLAVLTGRDSPAMRARLAELGIDQGLVLSGLSDKLAGLTQACHRLGVSLTQAAYIGDDLPDWPALQACGYPMAVAQAAPEVRRIARYVTQRRGGQGAVREAVEHLLRQEGRWEACLREYLAGLSGGSAEESP